MRETPGETLQAIERAQRTAEKIEQGIIKVRGRRRVEAGAPGPADPCKQPLSDDETWLKWPGEAWEMLET